MHSDRYLSPLLLSVSLLVGCEAGTKLGRPGQDPDLSECDGGWCSSEDFDAGEEEEAPQQQCRSCRTRDCGPTDNGCGGLMDCTCRDGAVPTMPDGGTSMPTDSGPVMTPLDAGTGTTTRRDAGTGTTTRRDAGSGTTTRRDAGVRDAGARDVGTSCTPDSSEPSSMQRPAPLGELTDAPGSTVSRSLRTLAPGEVDVYQATIVDSEGLWGTLPWITQNVSTLSGSVVVEAYFKCANGTNNSTCDNGDPLTADLNFGIGCGGSDFWDPEINVHCGDDEDGSGTWTLVIKHREGEESECIGYGFRVDVE